MKKIDLTKEYPILMLHTPITPSVTFMQCLNNPDLMNRHRQSDSICTTFQV